MPASEASVYHAGVAHYPGSNGSPAGMIISILPYYHVPPPIIAPGVRIQAQSIALMTPSSQHDLRGNDNDFP